jgi:hypothetical protein
VQEVPGSIPGAPTEYPWFKIDRGEQGIISLSSGKRDAYQEPAHPVVVISLF